MLSVLLIEDDTSIAEIYCMKLKNNGYIVCHARNGLEGVALLKTFLPDIILLDLMMPIMNGEQFLQKIRKKKEYKDIPVLILTNVSREEAPKTLWHLGINGYFVKANHTPSELVSIIKHITVTQ